MKKIIIKKKSKTKTTQIVTDLKYKQRQFPCACNSESILTQGFFWNVTPSDF